MNHNSSSVASVAPRLRASEELLTHMDTNKARLAGVVERLIKLRDRIHGPDQKSENLNKAGLSPVPPGLQMQLQQNEIAMSFLLEQAEQLLNSIEEF